MREVIASVLWRRLDNPGHDACWLVETGDGFAIEGSAVFGDGVVPARLNYRVACDGAWRSLRGEVSGWLGARSVNYAVTRSSEGVWSFNGAAVPGLQDCVDLDFGFTPATNLLQLRRIDLAIGAAADVPVAWLDVSAGTLEYLAQRYERRAESTYFYEAPRFEYVDVLEVLPSGFARRYPGLWESESD